MVPFGSQCLFLYTPPVHPSLGDEENGKGENFARPVIIIKKFNSNLCLAIPLSTKIKDSKYYFQINFGGKNQSVLISHIRTINVKRLRTKMGYLDSQTFENLKNQFKNTLF